MIDTAVVIVGGGVSVVYFSFEAIIIIGFVLMVVGALIPDKKQANSPNLRVNRAH